MDDHETLVLRPDFGAALRWSMAGVGLLLLAAWFVHDLGAVGWIAVGVAVAVAGYFVLQLVAPSQFEIVCDRAGLRGRNLMHRIEAPWESIHVARVSDVAGDGVLTVTVRGPYESATGSLLLPVGADVDALHRALAARLGRSDGGAT